jgi:hypothetical protein
MMGLEEERAGEAALGVLLERERLKSLRKDQTWKGKTKLVGDVAVRVSNEKGQDQWEVLKMSSLRATNPQLNVRQMSCWRI